MFFSTLRIFEADCPAMVADVQDASVGTMTWRSAGRDLKIVPKLFRIALSTSGFLMQRKNNFIRILASPRAMIGGTWTHWLVYSKVTNCLTMLLPSPSRVAAEMKGWSEGQKDRLGSAGF